MSSDQWKATRIKDVFHFHRGLLLEACEEAFGRDKRWNLLRSYILRQLSAERGLECKVLQIVIGDDHDEL